MVDIGVFMGPIISVVIVVMVIMMFVKIVKGMLGSKKAKMVDVPRSPAERLATYYKEAMQYNRCGAFKIKLSGDPYKKGYFMGWGVHGVIPDNTENIFFVRRKRFFTREKAMMLLVEPHLVKDLNTRELVIEARGVTKIGNVLYLIPTADTPKEVQDKLWKSRDEHFQTRLLQIMSMDLNTDLVESPKAAIRNSIIQASREEYEIGAMERMTEEDRQNIVKKKEEELEEERRRRATIDMQRQSYNNYPGMYPMGGGGRAG